MINLDELKARVYHGLKTNSLSAENWEYVICQAMGAEWIPGDTYLADGVLDNYVLNIKTLKQTPTILKTKENRDFLSHPERFNPTQSVMDQRRTGISSARLDEHTCEPVEIGVATFESFEQTAQRSFEKFPGTDTVLDVVVRYGEDRNQENFLVDIDIFEHTFYDARKLEWREVFGGSRSQHAGERVAVEGFNDGQLVARRVCGHVRFKATMYQIVKDLTKSERNYTTSVPLPDRLPFDRDEILAEIARFK